MDTIARTHGKPRLLRNVVIKLGVIVGSSVGALQAQANLPQGVPTGRHANLCIDNKDGTLECPFAEPGRGSSSQKMGYKPDDLAENLVDNGADLFRNLQSMEDRYLTQSKLATPPWSAHSWPNYKGLVARRYADPGFQKYGAGDWSRYRYYTRKENALTIWQSGATKKINKLSPAEKYDILVGDPNFTLTQAMWKIGEDELLNTGRIETWTGICDGSAAAAINHDRPSNVVKLLSADGKTWLNFYPSDIKALTAILWARNFYPSQFVGKRCNEEIPPRDASGRVTDDACFNTNPGTFHLSIVNQIGLSQRGMVMDISYNYEVWNHVIIGYNYSYFHPRTKVKSPSMAQTVVPLKQLSSDRYRRFRSPRAVYVVGVTTNVEYLSATAPRHRTTNAPTNDFSKHKTFKYDLELDAAGNIVGGEWHSVEHPDFLWVPARGHKIRNEGDALAVSDYTGDTAIPFDWQKAAQVASAKGSPLGKLVDVLIEQSRRP